MASGAMDNVSNVLGQLLQNTKDGKAICSMSVNPYDTAWVSMVAKPSTSTGLSEWLFPECFTFLLETQSSDGSWYSHVSDLDALLSTMAALLALLRHRSSPEISGCKPTKDIEVRIARSVSWLESKMQSFTLEHCADNVGFEILVPSLLRLLEEHGVVFEFPGLRQLLEIADMKMAKFEKLAAALYQGFQATALHSLEAFIGRVDFDRLKVCKRNGGMLGSPSSTAAYLMYATDWDDEAEQFLRDAFEFGEGKKTGGMASAHAIELFEMSWILSTLLEYRVELSSSDQASVHAIGEHLRSELVDSKGIIGFSRGMLPDADDTAKCAYTLQLLGQTPDLQPMLSRFQTTTVFKTYGDERTASLSTNCNVLEALLTAPNSHQYAESIQVAVGFMCEAWFSGKIIDKWNVANEYTHMLLAQGLTHLLHQKDGVASIAPQLTFEVNVILAQLLSHLLQSQSHDGSWGNGAHEITAYCILTLISLNKVPFAMGLNENIVSAIELGRKYLLASRNSWKPEPIWIEKVRYFSPLLTNSYCSIALSAPIPPTPASQFPASSAMKKMLHLFRMLPVFSSLSNPDLALKCALSESLAFLPYLKSTRLDIFPRSKDLKEEKYMEIIPFAWTACNALRASPLPANILLEMMTISLLNFQADEYFELITSSANTRALRWLVDEACGVQDIAHDKRGWTIDADARSQPRSDVPTPPKDEVDQSTSTLFPEISAALTAYANRVIQHPSVSSAPKSVQQDVRSSLAGYLQAQISTAGNRSPNLPERTSGKSLFDWVRTSGADDTSCPYSFAFYMALSGWVLGETKWTSSTTQVYLLKALRGNLATMCRIYNDYGSVARDRDEGNLNCIDFFVDSTDRKCPPMANTTVVNGVDSKKRQADEGCEAAASAKRPRTSENSTVNGATAITAPAKEEKSQRSLDVKAKKELMGLADFERQSMELALSKLKETGFKGKILEALSLLIDVTDLFGQIYVVKDIGTRTK